MDIDELADRILDCLGPTDGIVVSECGQIDVPDEWILVGTEVIEGKRVRVYDIPKKVKS